MATSDEINERADAPLRTRTDEGYIEERSINEMIDADRYTSQKAVSEKAPWGMSVARVKPGGTV